MTFFAYIEQRCGAQHARSTTGSAGRAARRNSLAKRSHALHNAAAMSPPSLRTARAGFTLIELVLALSIVAILAAVAAPNLRDFILNVRLTGQANDLLTAFMLARSEASKRDVRVTVCARRQNNGKGKGTDDVCHNGNQWANGWLVVVDADGDGEMDSGTTPLSVTEPLNGENTLKAAGKGPKGAIVYTPAGINASGPATFTLCDDRGKGRLIAVAATGRASISKIESGCQ